MPASSTMWYRVNSEAKRRRIIKVGVIVPRSRTKVDDTLTIFWCLFLAPETGTSCLMPETMTHFAGK